MKLGRQEKGRRVTRLLTGITGIPSLFWNGSTVETTGTPYEFTVTTDRSAWRFFAAIKDGARTPRLAFHVRYDGEMESVEDAIVAMRLSTFGVLLRSHYEKEVFGRGDEPAAHHR